MFFVWVKTGLEFHLAYACHNIYLLQLSVSTRFARSESSYQPQTTHLDTFIGSIVLRFAQAYQSPTFEFIQGCCVGRAPLQQYGGLPEINGTSQQGGCALQAESSQL
jgi:hypothetical protein